jgi:chromosome segregation ATPase
MALSHFVKLSFDTLSRFGITLGMATRTSFKVELRRAYKAVKRDLNRLLSQQQKLEGEIVAARKRLQSLESVCKAAGVSIESSADAAYLLQTSELSDEIRSILTANYPAWMRPNQVLAELERIGHNLSEKLSNPQASVQMILKRMVEAEEAQEEVRPEDGKKIYRVPRTTQDVENPRAGMTLAATPDRSNSSFTLSDLMGSEEPWMESARKAMARNPAFYGTPNPFGRTLSEMLNPGWKQK